MVNPLGNTKTALPDTSKKDQEDQDCPPSRSSFPTRKKSPDKKPKLTLSKKGKEKAKGSNAAKDFNLEELKTSQREDQDLKERVKKLQVEITKRQAETQQIKQRERNQTKIVQELKAKIEATASFQVNAQTNLSNMEMQREQIKKLAKKVKDMKNLEATRRKEVEELLDKVNKGEMLARQQALLLGKQHEVQNAMVNDLCTDEQRNEQAKDIHNSLHIILEKQEEMKAENDAMTTLLNQYLSSDTSKDLTEVSKDVDQLKTQMDGLPTAPTKTPAKHPIFRPLGQFNSNPIEMDTPDEHEKNTNLELCRAANGLKPTGKIEYTLGKMSHPKS